jgi:transcriptional regulator with XRE-family HTH domain
MTGNQLVAYNLKRARDLRGLTQEQAAELLEPYLDGSWSPASFSAAERSAIAGKRTREFTADDLLAFVAAFNLPMPFFLTPPPDVTDIEIGRIHAGRDALINSLFPPESEHARSLDRVRMVIAQLNAELGGADLVAFQLGQNPPRKPKEKKQP